MIWTGLCSIRKESDTKAGNMQEKSLAFMKDELMLLFAEPGKKKRHFKEAFGSEELYDEAFASDGICKKEWIDKNGLPVKKGLVELLEYLKKKNIPAALATPRQTAKESDGLSGYGKCNRLFQCISVRR